MVSFVTFIGGIGVGAFCAVLFLALCNPPDDTMTKEEFEQYQREWKELNDEYDVYDDDDEATLNEMFLDLEDDDEP